MIAKVKKALKVQDIRKRLAFTLLMLVIIRIGSQLPTPGVNAAYIKEFFQNIGGDASNFLNAFTGGSFEAMSVFALSITPYITSSIIIQLLTIAIPKLEEMQREGAEGRKKMVAITRYVTIALSLIESSAMAIGFGRQGLLKEYNFINCALVILILTAGSAFLMWIGERITLNGVGNGISMVLLINIVSRMPDDFISLYKQFIKGEKLARAGLISLIILAIILAVVVFVIVLQDAERKIPVQYSQKVTGRRIRGGQASFIPLKVNTAGVIPVIFASSIMQFPVVIASFLGKQDSVWLKGFSSGNWLDPGSMKYSWGLLVYIALTVFFAYFYTSITFNPLEVANNMKKSGGMIPGVRPGKPTSDFLAQLLKYIIFIGACGLVIVQIIPFFFNGVFGANVSFGGTSLIIVVGVVLETLKQIESRIAVRNYQGFLRF